MRLRMMVVDKYWYSGSFILPKKAIGTKLLVTEQPALHIERVNLLNNFPSYLLQEGNFKIDPTFKYPLVKMKIHTFFHIMADF